MVLWAFKNLSRLAICASIIALAAPSVTDVSNVVDLGYAKYAGNFTAPHAVAYLGVPYAEPPLGDRRFRAPLSLDTNRVRRESGGKTFDARSYPDFCVQGTTGSTSRYQRRNEFRLIVLICLKQVGTLEAQAARTASK